MHYQAICWDADGVVLKSPHLFSERLEIEYGIKNEKLQPFFQGVFKQCSIGRADLKEELAKVVGDWGWRGTVEELMDYWFTKGTELDQEVATLIASLREQGVRCVMTTDNEAYRGAYLSETFGNGKLLDDVFYSGTLGMNKKDPMFFTHVYQTLNAQHPIEKSAMLCIDDDEKNIAVANMSGFATHHYTNIANLKKFLSE